MAKNKRGASGISCLIGVNKPKNYTSHDVVNRCRRAFGERRVGHGGTLDPFATGVLPVMVGPATRLAQYFETCKKEYVAEICFGMATSTDDLTGEVVESCDVPEKLGDENYAREVLASFIGEQKQLPPQYSAIKVNGVRAYSLARKGKDVELAARDIVVYEAELLAIKPCEIQGNQIAGVSEFALEGASNPTESDSFMPGDKSSIETIPSANSGEDSAALNACQNLAWEVRFVVGSGTYIRSLARDIGEGVQCCAHLSSLKRTFVGGITLDSSTNMEELEAEIERKQSYADEQGQEPSCAPNALLLPACAKVLDPCKVLPYKTYLATEDDMRLIANGGAIPCDETRVFECIDGDLAPTNERLTHGELLFIVQPEKVLGIYSWSEEAQLLKAYTIFSTGVTRCLVQ
ncbi:MAG: tRNA pseudouridine(55) synthase TruB [Phoenicibacter congonensis]|uniref:tRNA pseudouridine synthase B n=1 Tax=Phoenicibacter congonensis TaxID=1944646 RepID=A0AA43RH87_9ACTN|nr:tRNA pseudouridine(55) synthase TruB [Phoenicibacter congonensis]